MYHRFFIRFKTCDIINPIFYWCNCAFCYVSLWIHVTLKMPSFGLLATLPAVTGHGVAFSAKRPIVLPWFSPQFQPKLHPLPVIPVFKFQRTLCSILNIWHLIQTKSISGMRGWYFYFIFMWHFYLPFCVFWLNAFRLISFKRFKRPISLFGLWMISARLLTISSLLNIGLSIMFSSPFFASEY